MSTAVHAEPERKQEAPCACSGKTACGCSRQRRLQRSATGPAPNRVPDSVDRTLERPGTPLDARTQATMQRRLGHDFSRVRVHTDPQAQASARAVGARAYTVGWDVILGAGNDHGTPEGMGVLAHELTHVAQQSRAGLDRADGPVQVVHDHGAEREAHAAQQADARPAVPSVGGRMVRPLQRWILLLEPLLRLFGGGTFSDEELLAYLARLRDMETIEDRYDSDQKAIKVVEAWKEDRAGFTDLDVPIKRLLVREMLSGWVGGDERKAIVDLLWDSSATEVRDILDPREGASLQRLRSELGDEGDEQRDRFETVVGLAGLVDPELLEIREHNIEGGRTCDSAQAMQIYHSQQRAVQLAVGMVRLLNHYLQGPEGRAEMRPVIERYFQGASDDDVRTIRDRYADVPARMSEHDFHCTPEGQPCCDAPPGEFAACVMGPLGQASTEVCHDFFEANPESQGVMMLHETIHRAGAMPRVVGGTEEDEVYYGDTPGIPLARALVNAGSYDQLAAFSRSRMATLRPGQGTPTIRSMSLACTEHEASETASVRARTGHSLGFDLGTATLTTQTTAIVDGHHPGAAYKFLRSGQQRVWVRRESSWSVLPGVPDIPRHEVPRALTHLEPEGAAAPIFSLAKTHPELDALAPDVEEVAYLASIDDRVEVRGVDAGWTSSGVRLAWHSEISVQRGGRDGWSITHRLPNRAAEGPIDVARWAPEDPRRHPPRQLDQTNPWAPDEDAPANPPATPGGTP